MYTTHTTNAQYKQYLHL